MNIFATAVREGDSNFTFPSVITESGPLVLPIAGMIPSGEGKFLIQGQIILIGQKHFLVPVSLIPAPDASFFVQFAGESRGGVFAGTAIGTNSPDGFHSGLLVSLWENTAIAAGSPLVASFPVAAIVPAATVSAQPTVAPANPAKDGAKRVEPPKDEAPRATSEDAPQEISPSPPIQEAAPVIDKPEVVTPPVSQEAPVPLAESPQNESSQPPAGEGTPELPFAQASEHAATTTPHPEQENKVQTTPPSTQKSEDRGITIIAPKEKDPFPVDSSAIGILAARTMPATRTRRASGTNGVNGARANTGSRAANGHHPPKAASTSNGSTPSAAGNGSTKPTPPSSPTSATTGSRVTIGIEDAELY